jgi:GTPase SAR1 family protein
LSKALTFNPYSDLETEVIHNSGNSLYFVSIMKNRLDPNAKRGAVVKALAFGSRRPNIPECFKAVAGCLLEKIFMAAEESMTTQAYE